MRTVTEIHLIHLSHTDIGYTHDQPTLWDLQRRFLDRAIDLCERDADDDGPSAFRWTAEATAPVTDWLESASPERVEALRRLEADGRIELTAMPANITPLYGPAEMIESLQPVETLRERYGFDVRYAMNFDVNGQNWPLVDALLDAGVEGFWMGINNHFGAAPTDRPSLFRWEGPSGVTLPTLDGYHYSAGLNLGIGRDVEEFCGRWRTVAERLNETGYDLPTLPVPTYHPFGDNGPPFDRYCEFVEEWNSQSAVVDGDLPTIRFSTPSLWWASVEDRVDNAPIRCGDWTDYWNFGCLSSARETGINRNSRRRLLTADAMEAVLGALGEAKDERPSDRRMRVETRRRAWRNLLLYDEHTWGADTSISVPRGDDTGTQWNHKANYAHTARSHSNALRRDAVAEIARYVAGDGTEDADAADVTGEIGGPEADMERPTNDGPETDLVVMNPLPWRRTQSGPVPKHVVSPRGVDDDSTAARHFQDRDPSRSTPAAFDNGDDSEVFGTDSYWLPPTTLPGFGYTVVSADELRTLGDRSSDERSVVETGGYRITFDRECGGVTRWYDVERDEEWVDDSGENRFAGVVHERVADDEHDRPRQLLYRYDADVDRRLVATGATETYDGFQSDWHARRWRPTDVLCHRVTELPSGYEVRQRLAVPSLPGPVSLRMLLDNSGASMIVDVAWEMGLDTHPESTYVTFPFALDDPTPYVDVGGQAMRPGRDQLSESCHNYYTVQRWAALDGDERSVTVGCPINPLVQFGDFHFADNQSSVDLDRALLLGWVTSNYWDTNFRARQPGLVRGRYHISLRDEPFDEAMAHRVGLEAEHYRPLAQTTGEASGTVDVTETSPNRQASTLGLHASTGRLLNLPDPPVLVHHVRPAAAETIGTTERRGEAEADRIDVVLRNASDTARCAMIKSETVSIEDAHVRRSSGGVDISDGTVEVAMEPRALRIIRLRCSTGETH
jgi:hypothetical protein